MGLNKTSFLVPKTKSNRSSFAKAALKTDIKEEEKETKRWHQKELRDVGATRRKSNKNKRPKTSVSANALRKKGNKLFDPKYFAKPPEPAHLVLPPRPPQMVNPQPVHYITDGKARPDGSHLTPALAANGMAEGISTGQGSRMLLHTGNDLLDTMLTGVPMHGTVMPDPYTSVKTFTTGTLYQISQGAVFPSSATTTYGGFALEFTGSGHHSMCIPAMTAGASTVTIDWTWANSSVAASVGLENGEFVSRPQGMNLTLIPKLVGPLHSVQIFAVPLLPMDLELMTTSSVANHPQTCASPMTMAQVQLGGRVWSLTAGEQLSFCCSPLDNRSFDFKLGGLSRGMYASQYALGWGGWVIWGWGFTAGDGYTIRMNMAEEHAIAPTAASLYGYPRHTNYADPVESSNVKNWYSYAQEAGLGAIGYFADEAADFMLRKFVGGGIGGGFDANDYNKPLLAKILGRETFDTIPRAEGGLCSRGVNPPFAGLKDDQKDEKNDLNDEPIVLTPKNARRPSLATSLTSRKK